MDVKVRHDPHASIGRIIVCGPWSGNVDLARSLLSEVSRQYPKRIKTQFLVANGGFVSFDMDWRTLTAADNRKALEEAVE
jgi:hypothetical protein